MRKTLHKTPIKVVSFDVDGVLTDGTLNFGEAGEVAKSFHARDGHSIQTLVASGYIVVFMSASKSKKIIESRAKSLGVTQVFTGVEDKLTSMSQLVRSLSLTLNDVCHVGDDLQDISLLEACGISVCPQDAVWQVKKIVDLVLTTSGGKGCVRELTERLRLH